MTRDDMLKLLDRRVKGLENRDADALAADYAETAVLESPLSGQSVGREAIRRASANFLEAFSDVSVKHEGVLIDGNRMAHIFKFNGTHTGDLLGVRGTGKRIIFRVVTLYTIEGNLIVGERRIYDFTGFLVKIGLLRAQPA